VHNDSDLVGIIIACTVGAIYTGAMLWVFTWVMRDAETRGKPPRLVALLVVLLQIPGLLMWLAFRPEKKL
jgi:hypothetical protein